jgi:p-aminobenzoyl-glutamate transporter AbgT
MKYYHKHPIEELQGKTKKLLYIVLFSVILAFIGILTIISTLVYGNIVEQNTEYKNTIQKLEKTVSEQDAYIQYLNKLLMDKNS